MFAALRQPYTISLLLMQIDDKADATPEPKTTLILVRHGETEANVQQRWYGAMDAPLTERGRRQVAATAAAMAEINRCLPIDVFYVSPLPRAQATAGAIADAIHMRPQIENGLREFDLGDWEGRTFKDLHTSEDLWGRWEADPTFAPPNGESPASFSKRVEQAVQSLVSRHPGQTILIVSHGALIGNILTRWLGDSPEDWRRWDPPNCSITIVQKPNATPGAEWTPVQVNDVSHLPEDIQTGGQAEETPA